MAVTDIEAIKETLADIEDDIMAMIVPPEAIDETDIVIEVYSVKS